MGYGGSLLRSRGGGCGEVNCFLVTMFDFMIPFLALSFSFFLRVGEREGAFSNNSSELRSSEIIS